MSPVGNHQNHGAQMFEERRPVNLRCHQIENVAAHSVLMPVPVGATSSPLPFAAAESLNTTKGN